MKHSENYVYTQIGWQILLKVNLRNFETSYVEILTERNVKLIANQKYFSR